MTPIGLLLVGAGFAVHLQELRGLDASEAAALSSELGRAIEARTASVAVVDDPAWSGCAGGEDCLARIRTRTGASEVLLVRAFAVGGRLRVTLERTPLRPNTAPRTLDLLRDTRTWREPVVEGVNALYAPGTRRFAAPIIAETPQPAWWPWAAMGAGVGVAGVGVVFGASSAATFTELESGLSLAATTDAERSSARGEAIAANVLIGVGLTAVVVGVVGWLTD